VVNATSSKPKRRRRQHFAVNLGLCGAALGVAPLCGITLFALPLAGGLGSGAIAVAAALHLFFWRPLHALEFAGDPSRGAYVFILAAAGVTVVWGSLRTWLVPNASP
jgi:hypothetical protein